MPRLPQLALCALIPLVLSGCGSSSSGGDTASKPPKQLLPDVQSAVAEDQGDRPGTNPGQLYVAASGPALPLRVLQTGPQKPGGSADPTCGGGSDTTKSADVRLSNFDKDVKISAPPGALDLQKLAAG